MSDNKDKDVPRSNEYPTGEVNTPAFDNKVHIFWGPGQLTESYPNYTPPNPQKWHNKEQLNIPQVVRFIYATKDDYANNEYNNDSDPPPPPADECEFSYVLLPGYVVSIKNAFSGSIEITYNTSGLIQPAGGSESWTGPASAILSDLITVKNSVGIVIYSGTWFDCPQLRKTPFRELIWTKHCDDVPDKVIYHVVASMGYTHDPEEAPRCWAPFTFYDSGLDEVRDAPENGYTPGEIPPEARDFMHCSGDPPT